MPGGRGPRIKNEGGSNSVVESQPSKLLVAGSIPVSRSNLRSLSRASVGKPAKVVRRSPQGEGGLRRGTDIDDCRLTTDSADVAQLAERVLGKDEVTGPIPVIGSNVRPRGFRSGLRLVNQPSYRRLSAEAREAREAGRHNGRDSGSS